MSNLAAIADRHEFEWLDTGPYDWSLKHPKACTDLVLAGKMSLLDCPYDLFLRAILTPRPVAGSSHEWAGPPA